MNWYLLAAMDPGYDWRVFEKRMDIANQIGTPAAHLAFRSWLLSDLCTHGVLLQDGEESEAVFEGLSLDYMLDAPDGHGCFQNINVSELSEALNYLGARGCWTWRAFEETCNLAQTQSMTLWNEARQKVDYPEAVQFLARSYGCLVDRQSDAFELYIEHVQHVGAAQWMRERLGSKR